MNSLDSLHFLLKNTPHMYYDDSRICMVIAIVVGLDEQTMKVLSDKHAWSEQTVDRLRRTREDFISRKGETL